MPKAFRGLMSIMCPILVFLSLMFIFCPLTVFAANNAQFVSQNVPQTMAAGQTYTVSVTMKNTGTTTWTASGNYRLGSQNPRDNLIWGGRILLGSAESVAPGQIKTFTFNVKAPATPGTYNFQWQILQESIEWFGEKTPDIAINVATNLIDTLPFFLKAADNYDTVLSSYQPDILGSGVHTVYYAVNGDLGGSHNIDMFQVKFNNPDAFDWWQYRASDQTIYHMYDMAETSDQYRWVLNPGIWLPRFMSSSLNPIDVSYGTVTTYGKPGDNTQIDPPAVWTGPMPYKIWFTYYPSYDFGGDVGSLEAIGFLWDYRERNNNTGGAEELILTKEYGFTSWKAFDHNLNVVGGGPFSYVLHTSSYAEPNFNCVAPHPYIPAAQGTSKYIPSDTPSCQNQCFSIGAKQCSGNGVQTCGNYDSDSCLEWSGVTACTAGQTCSNGACASQNSGNQTIDILPYLLKSDDTYGAAGAVGPTNFDMRQIRYHNANGDIDIFWLKWGSAKTYEWWQYRASDQSLYHMFDPWLANDRCGRWTMRPGKMANRYMAVGESMLEDTTFYYYDNSLWNPNATIYTVNYQVSPPLCPTSIRTSLHQPHYWTLTEAGNKNFGGDIGNADYIALTWSEEAAGPGGRGERFIFAKGYGWIGWEDTRAGTPLGLWPYVNRNAPAAKPDFSVVVPNPYIPSVQEYSLGLCRNDSECSSGNCNSGTCCSAGQCGWGGDGKNWAAECVASSQIRENVYARLVCRSGTWKVAANGWGCSSFECDSGLNKVIVNGPCYCRSACGVDVGVAQSCASGEACPSGTSCNNMACCPPGTCGIGGPPYFTTQCMASGQVRENSWARFVCDNGTWKVPLYGWGCGTLNCQQGTCVDVGGGITYCKDAAPIPSSASGVTYDTCNACLGTCKSCASQGFSCGTVSDKCGGVVYCGSCGVNQTCRSGQCMSINLTKIKLTCPSTCQVGQRCTCVEYSCPSGIILLKNMAGKPINILNLVRSGDFPIKFFSSAPYSRSFFTVEKGTVRIMEVCFERIISVVNKEVAII